MLPDAAIGPVIAALVAATLSFLGLVVAKEQKVSEFRQAWIDAVRSDLGAVISSVLALRNVKATAKEEDLEAWKIVQEEVVAGNAALLRLRLRLNPDEPPSAELLVFLERMETLMNQAGPVDDDAMNTLEREIVEAAGPILKAEWKRVKRGEPIYWISKWAALAILVAGAVLAGMGYFHWPVWWRP